MTPLQLSNFPEAFLKLSHNEIRKLPLAVALRVEKNVTAYKISGERAQQYYECMYKPGKRASYGLMPDFDYVKEMAKKLGSEIPADSLTKVPLITVLSILSREEEPSYVIYSAMFEEEKQQPSVNAC